MSLLGKCEGCAAKDDELAFLRSQNKQLTDKILAVVDPALEARQAHARRLAEQPPPRPDKPQEPPARASAAFFRRTRRDGGIQPPHPTATQVEESFRGSK